MTQPPLVALTGGTGFVGQATRAVLAAKGVRVRALARTIPPGEDDVEWISGGLGDEDALARLVAGVDAVIHVAGLTNARDPAAFEVANVEGTRNLLVAVKQAGVQRLVCVSSLSAREPQLSAYGASKERAERLVMDSGLDWTVVRPPAVYGPRDRDMFELFRLAKLGVVPVPPPGRVSLIHVDDLAALLVALIPGGDMVSGKLFEPDDGHLGGWTHAEMALLIADAVGGRRPLVLSLPKVLLSFAAQADRLVRGDKARLTPDRVGYMAHPDWVARPDFQVSPAIWRPRIASRDGLESTARWYRAQGWL